MFPYDDINNPWIQIPRPNPSALDDLAGVEPVTFDPSAFPTVEGIEEELDAAEMAEGAADTSIFSPVTPDTETFDEEQDAAEEEHYQNLLSWDKAQAAKERVEELGQMPSPAWAKPSISPEAEAELTGQPVKSFSQDLSARQGSLGGADLNPGIVDPSDLEMDAEFTRTTPTLGADISLDPTGVIDPSARTAHHDFLSESDLLTEQELEAGKPAIPVQDLTDEALAMRALEIKQAHEEERRAQERQLAEESAARKLRNAEIYESKISEAKKRTENILLRSQELGREKLDSKRWIKNQSTLGKIGTAFSILVGGQQGFASGKGGNKSLDFFQELVNQDIEEQKFNIEKGISDLNRERGLVSEIYQQTGDLYEATEIARLAAYEAGIAKIDGELAKLDPEGTQAVAAEMQKRELQGRFDAHAAEIANAQRKQAMSDAKWEVEILDKESAIKKRNAETLKIDAERRKLEHRGTGVRKPKIEYMKPDDQVAWMRRGFEPFTRDGALVLREGDAAKKAAEAYLNSPESEADPLKSAQLRDAVASANKKEIDAETARTEKTLFDPGRRTQLLNPDGTPFVGKTVAGTDAAQKRMADAQNMAIITDNILILRHKDGGASEILKSDEWQKLKSAETRLSLGAKDRFNLGVLAGADLDLIEMERGGVDVASFIFDAAPGLKASLEGEVTDLNLDLAAEGYKERWEPTRKRAATNYERPTSELETEVRKYRPYDKEDKTPDDFSIWMQRNPPLHEMQKMGRQINSDIDDGVISRDEGERLAARMMPRYFKLTTKKQDYFKKTGKHKDGGPILLDSNGKLIPPELRDVVREKTLPSDAQRREFLDELVNAGKTKKSITDELKKKDDLSSVTPQQQLNRRVRLLGEFMDTNPSAAEIDEMKRWAFDNHSPAEYATLASVMVDEIPAGTYEPLSPEEARKYYASTDDLDSAPASAGGYPIEKLNVSKSELGTGGPAGPVALTRAGVIDVATTLIEQEKWSAEKASRAMAQQWMDATGEGVSTLLKALESRSGQ